MNETTTSSAGDTISLAEDSISSAGASMSASGLDLSELPPLPAPKQPHKQQMEGWRKAEGWKPEERREGQAVEAVADPQQVDLRKADAATVLRVYNRCCRCAVLLACCCHTGLCSALTVLQGAAGGALVVSPEACWCLWNLVDGEAGQQLEMRGGTQLPGRHVLPPRPVGVPRFGTFLWRAKPCS